MDLGTDSFQAYVYHNNGNLNWSYTTISIVFVPLVTRCISEILKHSLKKNRGKTDSVCHLIKESLKEIAKHIPILQQIFHCVCLKELKDAKDLMEKNLKLYKSFDPDTITDENRKDEFKKIQLAATEYVNAEEKYLEIMTKFQHMKLYESFGESAPQAAFQISIVLQEGTLSGIQVFTISTSLIALTLGASQILLMMATKDKPVRKASWRTTWFLVLPSMFMVVIPRILSISLMISYTKEYFLIVLAIFFALNLIINQHHLKRDPPEIIVGILTNTFASCIVIQEGSGFFRRSGTSSSLLHIISLLCLCIMVGTGFNLCPDTAINRPAPILHCFEGNFSADFVMKRCEWPTMLRSDCNEAVQNLPIYDYDDLNCTSLMTIGQSISNKSSITFCKNMPWWLPLTVASGMLAVMHIVSILMIRKALKKVMSSIHIFRMSKSCFPASLFDPILTQEEENHMDDLSEFLKHPTKDKFKEINSNLKKNTGEEILDLIIRNDHFEVMRILLEDRYLPINREMLCKVIKKGSPLMIKIFLRKKQEMIRGEQLRQKIADKKEYHS